MLRPTSFMLVLFAACPAMAATAAKYDLTPRSQIGETNRVTIELKVGGDLLAKPVVGISAKESATTEATRLPMSVNASLEYDELLMEESYSARNYVRAGATIKVDDGGKTPQLEGNQKLVIADGRDSARDGTRAVLYAPAGPLSREQLDLIDVVGNTLAIDALLPNKQIELGGSWNVEQQAMASLLGLDSVAVCEVSCVLDDGNKKYARFQLSGVVHGTVDSAPTEFDVRAIGLFHRGHKQITQLNLAVTEKRDVGPATPGLDGTAKATIRRMPTVRPAELSKQALAGIESKKQRLQVSLRSNRHGFEVDHSREWFVAGSSRLGVTLRQVDESGLTAQSTFRKLPAKQPGKEPTPESFEQEIRFSLGDSFRELVSSEQWTNAAGCRCMGMVVRGETDGVKLEWRHYLAMPPIDASTETQHMVSLATTVQQEDTNEVGKTDRALMNSLRLVPVGQDDVTPITQTTKHSAPKFRSNRRPRSASRKASPSRNRVRSLRMQR